MPSKRETENEVAGDQEFIKYNLVCKCRRTNDGGQMRFAHIEAVKSVLIPLELWHKAALIEQKIADTYQIQTEMGRWEADTRKWNEIWLDMTRYADEVKNEIQKLYEFEELNEGFHCSLNVNRVLNYLGWSQ